MLKYWHHHISTALTVKTSTACSEKGSRYIFTNILINWLCTDLNNFQDAATQTNCARGDTICICPLQVDNIFAFIRQVAPVPACWLFKTSATSWPLTFRPWKWCQRKKDVGYICANFSLSRPFCSRVRPDVCDRQTDVRQTDKSIA